MVKVLRNLLTEGAALCSAFPVKAEWNVAADVWEIGSFEDVTLPYQIAFPGFPELSP